MSDVNNGISRRSVLKGAAIGGAGLVAGGSLLAGCGKKQVTGDVRFTIRGNLSDAGAKIAIAANDAYTAKTGNKVISQAVNSDDFQNNFVQILQGTPDDAFGWMAGWRTNARADAGLLADVSEQVKALGSSLSAAAIQGATNPSDGKQYIIPTTYYPWGLHYRKSTMQELGLDPESISTWDDLIKLCEATQKKGLVGYALGDKGGWEAMGTFRYSQHAS